jgi:APA family basic amino acid/polyamine antiporter
MAGKQFFAKKSIERLIEEMHGENRLRRVLGPVSLTSLGVGAIIGAGIFATTGRVAAQDAGPAVVLSYAVAGLGCAFAALCYAEMAAMVPVAGSAYTYTYATLGELFAWIIGWDLVLEYAMSCATVASAWSGHFREFLDIISAGRIRLPAWMMSDPFTKNPATGEFGLINLPAVLILVVLTIVLVLGIRESARTNNLLVVVKIAVVLFVIALGVQYINWSNYTAVPVSERLVPADPAAKWGLLGKLGINRWLIPLEDATRSNFTPYGISGTLLGSAIVFFAFIGFDSISTHSEEARRPQRDVPIGIIASLLVCTVLYFVVSGIIVGLVPYPQISVDAAIAAAFKDLAERHASGFLRLAALFIATGALAGMTSVILVTFLSQARIFLAMSRDGLLPPSLFGAIHPRFRTPHRSTILTGAVCCVAAAFTPITALEEMVNIGTLMAFVMVCSAVLILRRTRPDAQRPFRCPAVYVIATLGILFNLGMSLFLAPQTWIRLVAWLAIGLVIYFCYGRHHSIMAPALAAEIAKPGAAPTGTRLDEMRGPARDEPPHRP